jgi:hypothetical protein
VCSLIEHSTYLVPHIVDPNSHFQYILVIYVETCFADGSGMDDRGTCIHPIPRALDISTTGCLVFLYDLFSINELLDAVVAKELVVPILVLPDGRAILS